MTDLPPTDPATGPRPTDRSTSVTLRHDDGQADDAASLMDPATKSLEDALRITFRLLQVSMAALLVVFLFSGMQRVNQNERGIRVTLGRITADNLPPGPQFSWPYPFGELIKIQTVPPTLVLDREFWPNLNDAERNLGVEALAGTGRDSLDPVLDGSLLTRDGSIMHLKAEVKYLRTDPVKFYQAIDPTAEVSIVRAAVSKGLVEAASIATPDQVLAMSDSLKVVAYRVAQRMLDSIDCGLTIQEITLTSSMPPRRVAVGYRAPASAEADKAKFEQEAVAEQQRILNNVAGPAARTILNQIDRYESLLALDKTDEAKETLDVIDRLLTSRPVTIDGLEVSPRLEGDVPAMLRDAELARRRTVDRAVNDRNRFLALAEGYAAFPGVVMNSQWTDAFKTFVTRESVQVQLVPAALARLVITINRDQSLAKEQTQKARQKEAERLQEELRVKRERERLEKRVRPDETQSSQ
ncbi:MAG: hypothetical protein KF745_05195 [Phycisphaeraceae bacterium]|nr:hypothetical protein [Phycisphaeraceae bacterium]